MKDWYKDEQAKADMDKLCERLRADDPDDVIDWPQNDMDGRFWDPDFWRKLYTKAGQVDKLDELLQLQERLRKADQEN